MLQIGCLAAGIGKRPARIAQWASEIGKWPDYRLSSLLLTIFSMISSFWYLLMGTWY